MLGKNQVMQFVKPNRILEVESSTFQPAHAKKEDEKKLTQLEPSAFFSLVLPAFRFFKFIGLTPSSYFFDSHSQKFVQTKGYFPVTVITVVIWLLTAFQTQSWAKINELQVKNNTIIVMNKVLGFCYVVYFFTLYYAMLTKGENFTEIFDLLQNTCCLRYKAGCEPPSKAKVRALATGSLLVGVTLSTLYAIGMVDKHHRSSAWDGLYNYIQAAADTEARAFWLYFARYEDLEGWRFSESNSFASVLTLACISLILNWLGSACWCGGISFNILWGLSFTLLLRGFLKAMRANSAGNTMDEIRKFNYITSIIEKYNCAFGTVVLSFAVTGIIHLSVNIFQLFNEASTVLQKVSAFGSFLWFGTMLVSSAQVNKEAATIADTIKARYQMEQVWKRYDGNSIETTQGLMLVLHEIQTDSIGFKGLGFFTCTYGFIRTVVGAIATYAVIVIQFQS